MILLTMSSNEVKEQIRKDNDYLESLYINLGRVFYKTIKKYPRTKYQYYTCTSPYTKQKYLVMYQNVAKSKKFNACCNVTMAVVESEGRTYYYEVTQNQKIRIITSHFVKRYCERMGIDTSKCDALAYFFLKNNTNLQIYKSDNRHVYAVNEGICLTENKNGFCYMRTFVSYDLLKTTQKEAYEVIMDYVKKTDEDFDKISRECYYNQDVMELRLHLGALEYKNMANEIYKQYYE